jgi:hypothetical protein
MQLWWQYDACIEGSKICVDLCGVNKRRGTLIILDIPILGLLEDIAQDGESISVSNVRSFRKESRQYVRAYTVGIEVRVNY